jgi:hypothetical protein
MRKNMVNKAELVICSKTGKILFRFDLFRNMIVGQNEEKQNAFIAIIPQITEYIKGINFPNGQTLIRGQGVESRIVSGEKIITILFIASRIPLDLKTESILTGLVADSTTKFETDFKNSLENLDSISDSSIFNDFSENVGELIDQFGFEAFELYQKFVLIEAMNERIPQSTCLPLMERISQGEDVIEEINALEERWHDRLRIAISKVNYEANAVWEIFSIPMIEME